MLPENITAILARNERWEEAAATEPFEAGWAREAMLFVRSLKAPEAAQPVLRVQISPDGMHWLDEGATVEVPAEGEVAAVRLTHFGNWLRLAGEFDAGSAATLLVTLHLKA
ncbi:DUF6385 domain-containing protein [Vannielia sp. SX4]|uniref:DUF6385 domain-containing protein n=1 Tax=Vannielia sp. SX4 TaxID=3463852 RepID=UPI00405A10CE